MEFDSRASQESLYVRVPTHDNAVHKYTDTPFAIFFLRLWPPPYRRTMPANNRERRLSEDETAVPLLTVDSAVELDQRPQLGLAHPAQPYRDRNDEFRGKAYRKRTPLPLLQLFILCVTRLSEPISYTQIFPVSYNECLRIAYRHCCLNMS